jgi:microcystin-dependent protein
MSFRSGLSQRTTLTGIFFNNSECVTYSNTETNLSLIASLQYVQNFTNYFIYLTYLQPSNPAFQGSMNGENITLSGNLSTPTINGYPNNESAVTFTGIPTIQGQPIEYSILGEIKIVMMNDMPNNYLLCDGASISTTDYPDLFNLIGYTYGGSGNTFNLPNFESKFPIGANSSNANGNPTSNFAYGNNTTGATNTQSVSYTAPNNVSLLTNVPPHSHNVVSAVHSHFMPVQSISNVFFVSNEEGAYVPFVEEAYSPQPNTIKSTTTGVSVLGSGPSIQSVDTISGLNGVNITPSYISVFYAICYSQN